MSSLPKRFWKKVTLKESEGLYGPALDNRPVKLTGGAILAVRSKILAQALVDEWNIIKEGEFISPDKIPLTRIAGSHIEQIVPHLSETKKSLFSFGLDDALSYPSKAQDESVAQKLYQWIRGMKSDLEPLQAKDLSPLEHKDSYKVALQCLIENLEPDQLVILRLLAPLMSSFWLSFALINNVILPEEGFLFAYADEYQQLRDWGHDEVFAKSLEHKKQEFFDIIRYWSLLHSDPVS
ncbi:hypothetical protein GT348_02115 [Aristophania vespae]|uniref:ATP12 chaperone protein n=1 Tax=Aristophania vespae TaxID=2697033 RepID=A0A6P1NK47_9PROT|nr:ATP12 family protein [Aristophania vespae]QHI95231.1 hypothetical protein GT348_02115 [Aristophania vespae]